MKRWDIHKDGSVLTLYYKNIETARSRNPGAVKITENRDYEYLKFTEGIMQAANEILFDYRGRKVHKIPHNSGHIFVRLYCDIQDGKDFYYDGCDYQRHDEHSLIRPVTWDCTTPREFYEKFLATPKPQPMKIECERVYGEPKLKKPAACNNRNLLGSVTCHVGNPKGYKCKVWMEGNTVYVLHRDWFSSSLNCNDAHEKGLIPKPKSKFIYDDNFGCVILRNEAVISFGMPDIDDVYGCQQELTKRFAEMLGEKIENLYEIRRWEDFFESIVKLTRAKKPSFLSGNTDTSETKLPIGGEAA